MERRDREQQKIAAARAAVSLVGSGQIVGLGSGSTAAHFVAALGERLDEGELHEIVGVATSRETAAVARDSGVPLAELPDVSGIDLTVDGADEVDEALRLIKGGGGALLHEKIVAHASARTVIVVDESKRVRQLGTFPLAVEVVPMAHRQISKRLAAHSLRPVLRIDDGDPFRTDEGNYILDLHGLDTWEPPEAKESSIIAQARDRLVALATWLDSIVGVVEHGLFLTEADLVIVARADGEIERRERDPRSERTR